jgi:hypothetical protein
MPPIRSSTTGDVRPCVIRPPDGVGALLVGLVGLAALLLEPPVEPPGAAARGSSAPHPAAPHSRAVARRAALARLVVGDRTGV